MNITEICLTKDAALEDERIILPNSSLQSGTDEIGVWFWDAWEDGDTYKTIIPWGSIAFIQCS